MNIDTRALQPAAFVPAPSIHKTRFTDGTDPRNHIARCSCGWAYSGTWKEIRVRTNQHKMKNSVLMWGDKNRIFEVD